MRLVARTTRDYPAIVYLIVLSVAFFLFADGFLTVGNIQNIGRQSAVIAILAIGMTFTMLTGGIDLSIGSVAALAGTIGAWVAVEAGIGTVAGIGAALLVGIICGLVNGVLVVKVGIVPFVTTLATLTAYRSFTLLISNGRPIVGLDQSFRDLAGTEILGIPFPFIVALGLGLLCFIFLQYTNLGTHIYAIGGGMRESRLAGLRVNGITVGVYVVSGLAAAIGGVILTSRVASAQPNAAAGIELDVITAAVLGGVSLFGGRGRVVGAITGALAITVLGNGLNLMQVDAFIQQVAKGAALMIAVLVSLGVTGSSDKQVDSESFTLRRDVKVS